MAKPATTRRCAASRILDAAFGLTEAEQEQARAAAGKPWCTAYYVASRDWPVQHPGLTLDEAYAAVRLLSEQEEADRG